MYLSCMYVGGRFIWYMCLCRYSWVCVHLACICKKTQNNKQVYVSFLRSCVLCLVETGSFVWPGACWIGALSTECLGIFYIKPPCPTFSDVFWGSNSGPSTCMGITFPSELSPALNFLFLLSKRKRWRTFPNKHQLKFGMLLDDLQKHNKTMP